MGEGDCFCFDIIPSHHYSFVGPFRGRVCATLQAIPTWAGALPQLLPATWNLCISSFLLLLNFTQPVHVKNSCLMKLFFLLFYYKINIYWVYRAGVAISQPCHNLFIFALVSVYNNAKNILSCDKGHIYLLQAYAKCLFLLLCPSLTHKVLH